MTLVKAYWMGTLARLDGLNKTFNPFRYQGSQTLYHLAWERGFDA
jgi:hypothetical protein